MNDVRSHVSVKLLLPAVSFFILFFPSCKQDIFESRQGILNDSVINSIQLVLKADPVSALQRLDQIDTSLLFGKVSDSVTSYYYILKANALIESGKSEEATNAILSGRDHALSLGSEQVVAILNLWLTDRYTDLGQFFLARKYIEEALKILKNGQDNYQLARAFNLYGSLLVHLGQFAEGQKQFILARKLFEQLNKTRAVGAVYINMGNNFLDMDEKNKARECYEKAREIALLERDTGNYLTSLNGLSNLYTVSNPDSAWYYVQKIMELFSHDDWSLNALPFRFQTANILQEKKEHAKALDIYTRILDTCIKNSYNIGIYRAYSGIGNLYESINQDQKALEMYTRAYDMAVAAGETPTALKLLEAMLYMHKKSGDYSSAFLVQEKIMHINDSLLSLEKLITIHDLEMMYNKEKADRINDAMKADLQAMQRQIRFNHTIIGVILIFLATLSILLILIYRLYRQRDLAYQILIERYREDIKINDSPVLIPSMQKTSSEIPGNSHADKEEEYYQKILRYFIESKPYLNPQLKIEDVARALDIPRKILSSILMEKSGGHFTTFVNNYRAQEALRLLASPDYRNIKIDHIAKEAGFGSRVSFYTAFTQVTGFKPGNYRVETHGSASPGQ
jgi:AraC-like DNA-binding protein/Tfp pilus assembly protein PilF